MAVRRQPQPDPASSVDSAAAALHPETAERLDKMHQRQLLVCRKQAEMLVEREQRYWRHLDKEQAKEQHVRDHVRVEEISRRKEAQARQVKQEEAYARHLRINDYMISAREREVVSRLQRSQESVSRVKHEQRQALEAKKYDHMTRASVSAARRESLDRKRHEKREQLLQQSEARDARLKTHREAKAELIQNYRQVRARAGEFRTLVKDLIQAGRHESVLEELAKLQLISPQSAPASPAISPRQGAEEQSKPAFEPPQRVANAASKGRELHLDLSEQQPAFFSPGSSARSFSTSAGAGTPVAASVGIPRSLVQNLSSPGRSQGNAALPASTSAHASNGQNVYNHLMGVFEAKVGK